MKNFKNLSLVKFVIWGLFGLVIFTFVFIACRKDFHDSQTYVTRKLSPEIEAAKNWFESNQQAEFLSGEQTHLKKMRPQWDKAFRSHNVIEAPFTLNGKVRVPSYGLIPFGRQRLVIYDNGQSGRKGYVVNYVPSKAFTGKMNEITAMNFRRKNLVGCWVSIR